LKVERRVDTTLTKGFLNMLLMEESKRLVCIGHNEMKVYNMDTLTELKSISDYSQWISVICKIDDNHFATASNLEAKLNVYNINTFQRVQTIGTSKYNRIFNFNNSKLICTMSPSHKYDIRKSAGGSIEFVNPVQIQHLNKFNCIA
jgi:hypothetical protein